MAKKKSIWGLFGKEIGKEIGRRKQEDQENEYYQTYKKEKERKRREKINTKFPDTWGGAMSSYRNKKDK